jgi:phosphoglycerol transferase MdoB-like AlkP superfamily enzyme
MSKLKIVDDAIGKLLELLEENGKLNDTVIMLYADHEPYGISDEVFNQITKYDVLTSTGDVDRTPFIIYNPELTPTKYDEYTSFINILPTLANLFDLDYDPRLYGGEDLLSDTYTNVVAFADGSWRSDIAYFDATTSNITYLSDKTYSSEEIKKINNKIKTEMDMDNLAIKRDYFSYLNEKLNKGFVPTIKDISKDSK